MSVPFTVDADLDLGSAVSPWLGGSGADVLVRRGKVPDTLADAETTGAGWQYVHGRLLIAPPVGLRFLVEGGDTIRYEASLGAEDTDIRAFLLGVAWPAVALQRGLLPIHASAVSCGRNVFAFTGKSGRGKSTLTAALAGCGRDFFADDVLVLDPASFASNPRCWGYKDLKLWPDAVALTGAAAGGRVRTASSYDKVYATPSVVSPHAQGRFQRLYVLERGTSDGPCRIEKIAGRRSIGALSTAIHRRYLALTIVGRRQLFLWLALLARNLEVLRFERPWLKSRFGEVVACVDDQLPLCT